MTTTTTNANVDKNNTNNPADVTATTVGGTSSIPGWCNGVSMATGDASSAAAVAAAAAAAASRTMQSDEDFNIRFVNLVRTHRCLYDKKVPEYRNRDNQEKSWSLISQETRESVIHCKERWRNLRACLSRYIKQQNGAEPQHKPYYLTEHMAFLLPFLKSTRNSLDGNSSLATLFQFSQQQQQLSTSLILTPSIQVIAQPQLQQFNEQQLELKHSLSDEDEETIDAFDPAVSASLRRERNSAHSPALSDTASANTMQNYIPDVQLAELRTPEPATTSQAPDSGYRDSHDFAHEPKRIKSECHGEQLPLYNGSENSDMEFFRSILPDIASLTPQQKRKFKIGILELIDDVVERYPAVEQRSERTSSTARDGGGGGKTRRGSTRDWRK